MRSSGDSFELTPLGERLLPSALAHPWDLHMMYNVGGPERTLDQYRALLADAGFTLLDFKLP